MSYEKDIKELIEQISKQQGTFHRPINGPPDMGTDQSPHLFNQQNNQNIGNPDQSPIDPVNSVRPMGKPIAQTPRRELIKPAPIEGGCPQCGTIHPPIPSGQKCPLAPFKIKDGKEEREIDINKFLVDLKNIILSQYESKKIKDVEKLFKNIIVEVTKYLEGYRE